MEEYTGEGHRIARMKDASGNSDLAVASAIGSWVRAAADGAEVGVVKKLTSGEAGSIVHVPIKPATCFSLRYCTLSGLFVHMELELP